MLIVKHEVSYIKSQHKCHQEVTASVLTVLFILQVGDLRLALQRAEQAAARKEDYLRHEISELQQVLSCFSKPPVKSVSLEVT